MLNNEDDNIKVTRFQFKSKHHPKQTSLLFKMFVFILLGLGQEVIFTGIESGIKNKNDEWMTPDAHTLLLGYSSVYYSLSYAMAPLYIYYLQQILGDLKQQSWLLKGFIYGCIYHITEYLLMWTLMSVFGNYPSKISYSSSSYGINGFTRVDYFPFYMLSGLFFEHIYLKFD